MLLGVLLIDRNRSTKGGLSDRLATGQEDTVREQASGAGDATARSGDSPGDDAVVEPTTVSDPCAALTLYRAQVIANDNVILQGAEWLEDDEYCRYAVDGQQDVLDTSTVALLIRPPVDRESEEGSRRACRENPPCETIEEPMPTLPDGLVIWHEVPDVNTTGVSVEWTIDDQRWRLSYGSFQNFGSNSAEENNSRTDGLAHKDILMEMAEEIYAEAPDGLEGWTPESQGGD